MKSRIKNGKAGLHFQRRLPLTAMVCLFLIVLGGMQASAQKGLHIEEILNDKKYTKHPNSVMVIIKGDKLKTYNLSVFQSLTVTNWYKEAKRIEEAVLADGKSAEDSETVLNKNTTVACYYQFPPTKETKGRNRFILFQRKEENAVLIYLEGNTQLDKLINTFIHKEK